jgi:predicted permease
VFEVALTFVLLVGAALMVRTFLNAARVEPGFRPAGLLTLRLALPAASYPPDRRPAVFERLAAGIAGLPGVSRVGLTSLLPLAGGGRGVEYEVEGTGPQRTARPMATQCVVGDAYFRTTAIPLVEGRAFDTLDAVAGARTAIVSRALADREWPHGEAVGKRLRLAGGGADASWLTVVGVAGDIRYWRLEDTALPWIYVPLAQSAPLTMNLVVRSGGGLDALAEAIRAEVAGVDPDVPVLDLLTFEAVIGRSLWAERMFSRIFAAFGFVALALALIGIYGVISYSAAQRTKEIGIRAALGADRRSLSWLVLRDGARLAAAGVALGAVGAWVSTRAMSRLLYGVAAHDGWTFVVVSLFLLAVACLASYVPSRRAARMDPLGALREG